MGETHSISENAEHHTTLTHPAHRLVNVGENERYASVAGGVALILSGLARRGFTGLLLTGLGALVIRRGVTGSCPLYRAMKLSTAPSDHPGVPDQLGVKIERSISIDRPREELFALWRDFERLPQLLTHLVRVAVLDERRFHWIAKGPGDRIFEWDAVIISERPNELIAWESLPGAEIPNAGSVRFEPDPHGHGTLVRIALEYHLPGGELGALAARLLGQSPEEDLEKDLARLKQRLEMEHPVS